MGKKAHPFEQKLGASLQNAKEIRESFSKKLTSQGKLSHSYGQLLSRLRELSRGEYSRKDFVRTVGSLAMESRQAMAFRGPSDGIGKIIMKNLPHLGLSREDNLYSALLCVLEDAEQSFPNLPDAKLPSDDQLLVALCAMQTNPILDYEEYKTLEVVYQNANPDDPNEAREAQRRFEQARGRRSQHTKKHLLKHIPEDIKNRTEFYKVILRVAFKRDPFGALDVLREDTSGNSLNELSNEDKLELLDVIAGCGMGLASINLDIFNITNKNSHEIEFQLQDIFKKDVTSGSNLIGVYAFEGMHNYPFNIERIEPVLPRRVSSAAALDFLKRSEIESNNEPILNQTEKKVRTYTNNEIAETVTLLQEREITRFLEFLKWEIARKWKSRVGEKKRDILFADFSLKVRNILFLITYGLFEEEQIFENIYFFVQKSHPAFVEDTQKNLLLANRYYFLDILGLNPGLLFNRIPRRNDVFGTLIQEVSDFQIRKLLHLGMSIYIKTNDAILRNMPIAWNMLLGQCDGRIDQVFQEVGLLFDAIDTLLVILEPTMPDLVGWSGGLLDALRENAPELPEGYYIAPPKDVFRITTRTIISNALDALNDYSVKALYQRAKDEGVTPLNIIQVLRIDRLKSDKLRTLFHASSATQKQRR